MYNTLLEILEELKKNVKAMGYENLRPRDLKLLADVSIDLIRHLEEWENE